MSENYTLRVDIPLTSQRVDVWIHDQLPHLSRTRIKGLMEEGHIQVNHKKCQPSLKLKCHDMIHVTIPPAMEAIPKPQVIPLDVVYEDEDLLVLNKPAGLVVHPAPGHYEGTLVNGLLERCKDSLSSIGGVKRPGIVHRLDKGTSGLMVVAKNDKTHQGLSLQFSDRTLSRHYQALVGGRMNPQGGVIKTLIGRHPKYRQKMAVVEYNGKSAVTHYDVIESFDHVSLVKCRLETGRTHQIRVHLNYLGHGILGDPLYAFSCQQNLQDFKQYIQILKETERPLLHAYFLKFFHPSLLKDMSFTVPLPPDFLKALDLLRE